MAVTLSGAASPTLSKSWPWAGWAIRAEKLRDLGRDHLDSALRLSARLDYFVFPFCVDITWRFFCAQDNNWLGLECIRFS